MVDAMMTYLAMPLWFAANLLVITWVHLRQIVAARRSRHAQWVFATMFIATVVAISHVVEIKQVLWFHIAFGFVGSATTISYLGYARSLMGK